MNNTFNQIGTPPPPYDSICIYGNQQGEIAKLPSYDDIEKSQETTPFQNLPNTFSRESSVNNAGVTQMEEPSLTIISMDAHNNANDSSSINSNNLLGTDAIFLSSFTIAFIFNWIGFLVLTCFCHSVASRYGSLAGFGLSLAKWTLIVKHSTVITSQDNSWLWWLVMTFGFLICIRALIQYVSIKRTWRLLSVSAQERLLFFY